MWTAQGVACRRAKGQQLVHCSQQRVTSPPPLGRLGHCFKNFAATEKKLHLQSYQPNIAIYVFLWFLSAFIYLYTVIVLAQFLALLFLFSIISQIVFFPLTDCIMFH